MVYTGKICIRTFSGSNERVYYNDISDEAVRIINGDLKPELQKYTDISIEEVQVQAVYEGSIEIIYTFILGFLNLVSGLKDLYDAIQLISEISERHINKKLSEEKMRWNRSVDSNVKKRDAFFYYLLVANIVLLVIVGVLVFGAVKAMYFG